jgi:hypothetical protein
VVMIIRHQQLRSLPSTLWPRSILALNVSAFFTNLCQQDVSQRPRHSSPTRKHSSPLLAATSPNTPRRYPHGKRFLAHIYPAARARR